MMNTKTILSAVALLLAGVVTGFVLRGAIRSDQEMSPEVGTQVSARKSTSKSAPGRGARIGQALLEASSDERERLRGELGLNEIPEIMEYLLSTAGIRGVPKEALWEMKTLVRQWAEEDFDGVIAWSRSLSDRAAASQFLNTLIGDLAKEDQEGALDLVLSLRGDPDLKLFSAESLFNTAARRGVATALDLVSSYKKTKGRVSSFQAFEFPEGFDFATFANEARQFQSGRFGSVDLPFFPSNLMREWAKADFDEAFAFYVNHQQFRGNRFRDVLSEGFDLSDRETLFSWASEQFSVLEGEQRFRFASGLKEALGSGEIKSFIQNLPGERAQQEFVEELLRDGVDNSRFMEQLEVFPSVAERMDVIRRTNAFDNYGDRLREVLAVAGINEEQFNELRDEWLSRR